MGVSTAVRRKSKGKMAVTNGQSAMPYIPVLLGFAYLIQFH
jgi:hypothetical protein